MTTAPDRTALQLRSLVTQDEVTKEGVLELSLLSIPIPRAESGQVVVRIEGAPLNPSDLGLLFGAADMSTAKVSGAKGRPVLTAKIPERAMKAMAGRVGESMPVGNEGAGVVVEAGSSPAAQALLGRKVAILAGATYSQFRAVAADQCLVLPEGVTVAEGASAFVNPLTVLGMVGTMRAEGHTALVHTAAASALGQMLQRVCEKDGVSLVNIVRKPEQVELLKNLGARYVCNTGADTFVHDLTEAVAATGATLAFDALGGGKLAGQILTAMEAALNRKAKVYSRYGSSTHKQVYIYGALDPSPTELSRSFGMTWGIGGWLVFPFTQKIGPEATNKLKERIAAELTTTFATRYAKELSLVEMLQPDAIAAYGQRATGEKVLINPNKDLT